MNRPFLSIVIPAAGSSERLGQAKQLVLYRGKSLIRRAIDTAEGLEPREIIVVTGAHAKSVEKQALNSSAHCVHNVNWASGMGSSIALAASHVDASASGILILLCDQWGIDRQDLQHLYKVWKSDTNRIVCAESQGRLGPPVIFPRSCFASLRDLQGDAGAQCILQAHPELIIPEPIENAEKDLDTPVHLDTLRRKGRFFRPNNLRKTSDHP